MKNFSFFIILFSLAIVSCSKEKFSTQEQGSIEKTFNLAIEEPNNVVGSAPKTRAEVKMGRYLMEMYEGGLTTTPVKMTNTDGVFKVELKKGVDYLCLFWADGGASDYDAANLKAVRQADETQPATAAYCANVAVNSKTFDFNAGITLKRAVAELSFIDKNGLTEATNTLRITYPYASATLNVGDGTVTYGAGALERTITGITPPADKADAFTTDFVLAPTTAGKLAGLKFCLNNEEEKTVPETALQANYRTKITGEYFYPPMSFTIDTRNNTANRSDATFILPFKDTLSGYSLTVDWGDGNKELFADGAVLDEVSMTHTYSSAGEYTITIYSSQKDESKIQMPRLNFYRNYRGTNKNGLKLTSLNSPLLNMGTNLTYCFGECGELTEISDGLFDRNILATDFSHCFRKCEKLKEIPAGLFDKNTLVTNFFACFFRCMALAEIPAGLFDKNTLATDFYQCFDGCIELREIPEGLFEKNTLATRFTSCFQDCAKIKLNANIFCVESSETKATRFAGKKMIFTDCFMSCGKDSSIAPGEGGTAPALWEYTMTSADKSRCFSNVTKVTNVDAIDANPTWK